ncbi:ABC transporter permease [bacterium]|nr:ABC transporter permease [bacterium]
MIQSTPIRIEPSRGWQFVRWRDLWAFRELLWILIWRDLKVRYKQTVLGAAWAILQPFLTMVVFSIFFGHLAGLDKKVPGDLPYPVWAFAALLPWQLFAYALTESGNSLVVNRQLITKVYFPRLVIPLSAVLAGLVDFAIAFVFLAGMMAWYGIVPTAAVLTLPLFLLLAVATALAIGLWLSALNVEYRDVRYTIPFLTQFWLFLTPIAYPSSLIPEALRPVYGLNPMAGVVEGFRWALLGTPAPGSLLWVSVGVVVLLLVGGLAYFRRMERNFADVI